MTRLDLKNICSSSPDEPALKNLSFDCEAGEHLCLLGPKGSGKSAILNMLRGLQPISKGQLSIDGKHVTNLKNYKKEILFLNAIMNDPIQKIEKHLMTAKIVLCREYDNLFNAYPQTQLTPDHLNGLLSHHQPTCIGTTCRPYPALLDADRIIFMDQGEIVQIADCEEMHSQPATLFIAHYIAASKKLNLIEGKFIKKNVSLYFNEGDFQLPIPKVYHPLVDHYIDQEVILHIPTLEEADSIAIHKLDRYIPIPLRIRAIEATDKQVGLSSYNLELTSSRSTVYYSTVNRYLKCNDSIHLAIDTSSVHYFNKTTGKRIL